MRRRSSGGSTPATSRPSTVMVPLVASIMRLIIRRVVVLPQPDGPTRTVRSPSGTSKETLSTAVVPSGKRLVTDSKLINCRPWSSGFRPESGRVVWQRSTRGVNGPSTRRRRDHVDVLTQPYRPDSGTTVTILAGPGDLTREAVEAVAWGGERLALAPAALERVAAGQAELAALLAGGARVYGVSTGTGWLASVDLDAAAQGTTSATSSSAGRSAGRRGWRRPRPGPCWWHGSAICSAGMPGSGRGCAGSWSTGSTTGSCRPSPGPGPAAPGR